MDERTTTGIAQSLRHRFADSGTGNPSHCTAFRNMTGNSPWERANEWDKWTFSVPNALLEEGAKRALKFDDLLDIPEADRSHLLLDLLRQSYTTSKKFYFFPRILVALFKIHSRYWWIITAYTIFEALVRVALPVSLIFLLRALQDDSGYDGYIWAAVISALSLLQVLSHHVLFFFSMRTGWNWKNATTAFIHEGLFKLNSAALQNTMTGKMVNLISNDVARFEEYPTHAMFAWCSILEAGLILIVLVFLLDFPSALAGIGSTVFIIPLMIKLANWNADFRGDIANATDQRVRHIGEIIEGIASVKSYAWENPFFRMINGLRSTETASIRHSQLVRSANQGLTYCTPAIVSFITFTVYWRLGGELTIPKVFATMSLLQVMRTTIGRLWTRSIELTSETIACAERIQAFLDSAFENNESVLCDDVSLQEVDVELVEKSEQLEGPDASVLNVEAPLVSISNSSYYYGDDQTRTAISGIDFEVRCGELIMVVGSVGSGKSTLLSAVLGEIKATDGSGKRTVQNNAKIAYCAQRPWIVAASVKANVTIAGKSATKDFKNPAGIDEELYNLALDSSLLIDDLHRWPAFDRTEIGEKGLSISGGQKARVSLARAVYADSDLYILDDPLSAVDAHVGKSLMTNCIKRVLQGRKKGIILVTHQLQYLKHADKVLVLDKSGQQRYFGDYCGLLKDASLVELLELKISEKEEASADDMEAMMETSSRVVPLTSAKQSIDNNLSAAKDPKGEENEEDAARRRIVAVEDSQTGDLSWDVYAQYIKAGGVTACVGVMVLIFASQALLMITDYWLRWWASSSFGDQSRISYIWIFAILVFLCIVVGTGRALAWFRFSLLASSKLHERCLWAVLHSPLRFFVANPAGRILNRFAKDQNLIDETLPAYFFMFMEGFVYCLASLILVCISIPWLLLLLPLMGVLFVFLRKKYMMSTREIKRIEAVTRSPIYSDFSATLDGLLTLRAFKLQDKATFMFQNQLDNNGQAYFSFLMCARWLGFRLDLESALILVVIAFLSVVLRKQVDVGLIGFALVYTMALSGLFQWVVRLSVEVENQMTSVERIGAYASLPPESGYGTTLDDILQGPNVRGGENRQPLGESSADYDRWVKTIKGDVALNNLTVKYRHDLNPVLNDISIEMKGGTKVGICGRTGSGKSSTLLALLRLNIIVDGDITIDGHSILKMTLEQARGVISIIPQEPHLFSGTVRFNLDPFSVHADIDLWNALKDAHIYDYISQDPLGLSMYVEESGKNFSVGQRQLLSLARAILRGSKVVLMDEVTASIDFQTDRLIQETIRTSPAMKDATIITVAHRLRTIADSDLIVVVDAGRIAELDSPVTLLKDETSLYRRLAEESGEYDEIYRLGSSSAGI